MSVPPTPTVADHQTDDYCNNQTKLEHLGPIIVNVDGTLQRIANWTDMNETEQASAVRLITARNKKRLQALNEQQQEVEKDMSPPHTHRIIHQDLPASSLSLPFIDELLHHISSSTNMKSSLTFPIMFDPRIAQKALICGMFVVRPSLNAWSSPLDSNLYAMVDEWAFNYKGFDGGWLIAHQNVLDAFRLALQYGTADAVIVSSMTVAMEGVNKPSEDRLGYIWQPYAVTEWPHLKAAFPLALELITKQRLDWQQQGYLPTTRKYPAQIIYTGIYLSIYLFSCCNNISYLSTNLHTNSRTKPPPPQKAENNIRVVRIFCLHVSSLPIILQVTPLASVADINPVNPCDV